ncbi:hypothetical protein P3695_26050, partial [Vibrio parahaemolyticus]|nr:hypothetical protein [Vibrio parahaemolyticus]
ENTIKNESKELKAIAQSSKLSIKKLQSTAEKNINQMQKKNTRLKVSLMAVLPVTLILILVSVWSTWKVTTNYYTNSYQECEKATKSHDGKAILCLIKKP